MSRHRATNVDDKTPLTVSVDADVKAKLDVLREKESVNVSALVNKLLRNYLKLPEGGKR